MAAAALLSVWGTSTGNGAAAQKDGELKPGAKGISLNAKDQFSRVVDSLDEISAALDSGDDGYKLELSDKYGPHQEDLLLVGLLCSMGLYQPWLLCTLQAQTLHQQVFWTDNGGYTGVL